MMGNPLMNDPQLSQTAGRAKTRQPGLLVRPTVIVLGSYAECSLRHFLEGRHEWNPHDNPLPP
jgi:hypothetical protein